MWYQRLDKHLGDLGFKTSPTAPCLYFRRIGKDIIILGVYVDDFTIVASESNAQKLNNELNQEFRTKNLGQADTVLKLQITRTQQGIILHQHEYTKELLKKFYHQCSKLRHAPLNVRNLDPSKDIYGYIRNGEEALGPEYPYMAAIGSLLYLAQCTRPDIAFSVALLARHCQSPTMRHWKGVKQILSYLKTYPDLGLLYHAKPKQELIGYADAGYQSDINPISSTTRSQTGYLFTVGGTALSWKSKKQSIPTSSSSEAEHVALFAATQEALFLKNNLIDLIFNALDMTWENGQPTKIYCDNAQTLNHATKGYKRTEENKSINPKFFTPFEFHNKSLFFEKIDSDDNPADMLTKTLPPIKHRKFTDLCGLRPISSTTPI
jgi:hypothetical protein